MRPCQRRFIFDFMKNLAVLTALAVALLTSSAAAPKAAVLPDSNLRAAESSSVTAVRTLITRCLPGVLSGDRAPTAGLAPASEAATRRMLGDREGDVWLNVGAQVVMVDFRDVPVCRVVALSVDPAVLADLVMRVFSESETPFTRERFRLDDDGGFAAVYSLTGKSKGIVIRISTTRVGNGGRFATLTVERSADNGVAAEQ